MLDHFSIKELVPEHIYLQRGEKAWQLIDWRALKTLEWLRKELGYITVNDWAWGGDFCQSGLRTHEFYLQFDYTIEQGYEKISKSLSQHKFGRAFDCKFREHSAEYVRQWIKDNWHRSGFDWAITLEEDVSWVHFDVRNQLENKVYSFKP